MKKLLSLKILLFSVCCLWNDCSLGMNIERSKNLQNNRVAEVQQPQNIQKFLNQFKLICEKMDDFDFVIEMAHFHDIEISNTIYDKNGRTPLMIATNYGCRDIVSGLIYNGVDVNYKNLSGHNALFFAQKRRDNSLIEMLTAGSLQN